MYAAASPKQLTELRYNDYEVAHHLVVVCGEVSLWGDVVPGEHGWRAQFAYPRRLFIPYEVWQLAKPLREAYAVRTTLTNTYRLTQED